MHPKLFSICPSQHSPFAACRHGNKNTVWTALSELALTLSSESHTHAQWGEVCVLRYKQLIAHGLEKLNTGMVNYVHEVRLPRLWSVCH